MSDTQFELPAPPYGSKWQIRDGIGGSYKDAYAIEQMKSYGKDCASAALAAQAEAMQRDFDAACLELQAELARLRTERDALLAEVAGALSVVREYARLNPKWSDGGMVQDPNGAHAWLNRNDAARAQGGTPT